MKVSVYDFNDLIAEISSFTDEAQLPLKQQCDLALVKDIEGNIVVAVSHSPDYQEEVGRTSLWDDSSPPPPSPPRAVSPARPSTPGPLRMPQDSLRPVVQGMGEHHHRIRRALSPVQEEAERPKKKAKHSRSTNSIMARRSALILKLKNSKRGS